MGVIIGCTAWEACLVHGRLVGKTHLLRLENGRAYYDEIATSRGRYRISRTKVTGDDVVTIDRYIQRDTPVQLIPIDPPKTSAAAVRVPMASVRVEDLPSVARSTSPENGASSEPASIIVYPSKNAAIREFENPKISTALMVVDVKRGKPVATATPDVIRLPAYFGSGSGDYLAEARANYQAKIDASAPASKPYEYTGGYYGSYSYYSRNR